MRLRNIQGAKEVIANSPWVIQKPETHRGNWNTVFEKRNRSILRWGWEKAVF